MNELRTIKEKLLVGQPVIGSMIVQVRTPAIVQLFAEYGLDFIVIDMEHGPYNVETVADLIQTARLAGIAPLVRVGEVHYHLYSLALDMGAQGIISPRIENVEQVRSINRFMHYPPAGERGFSRLAAHVNFAEIDSREYVQWANEYLLNIIQIESKQAVEDLEILLSEPGIDGVLVGIDDLALSFNLPGETSHEKVEEALQLIFETCIRKGVFWGLHSPDANRLAGWMERGMNFILYSSDIWMLQQALKKDLKLLRSERPMIPG